MSTSVDSPVLKPFDDGQVDALTEFFAALPEGDRTFVKEYVDDPSVVAAWAASSKSPSGRNLLPVVPA